MVGDPEGSDSGIGRGGQRELGWRRRGLGWLTVVAGCGYSVFVLAGLFGSRLDPARAYVSELAAHDQPGSLFFQLADVVVGAVVVLAGSALARAGARRLGRAGLWFAAFGVATVLDSAAPMVCAPSAGSACPVHVGDGLAAMVGPHELTSLMSNTTVIVAMALASTAWRGRCGSDVPRTALERACDVGLPVAVATGAVAVLQATVFEEFGSWVGWAQRVQVVDISVVVVALGVCLLRGESAR